MSEETKAEIVKELKFLKLRLASKLVSQNAYAIINEEIRKFEPDYRDYHETKRIRKPRNAPISAIDDYQLVDCRDCHGCKRCEPEKFR